ncbi:MAG: metal-dependent hydrolase [Sphingomonas sanxanigenens]|uniref:Metal-dependent hydrolase n=1 Tax=Sphingomonas sanxanigenens TaxID=397260 RepID=A0A2W5AAL0_9SPHN|nr:MAG: metal-dependent hydrolase [Sphingomonas sanxanigenens]
MLAACALLASPALADGLIDNVDGVTLDEVGHIVRFSGLLVTPDGKVARLLDRGEKRPDRLDFKLDAGGKTMIPGLIDAHGHVMALGYQALTLDLSDTGSLEEAKAKIAAYAAANPGRSWILGSGWNQEKWKLGRFPTAADLDAIVADKPVWLARVDGHAGWANSLALKAAGVTARTTTPPGGRIEKVGAQPSGIFVDNAMSLMEKVLPAPNARDRDLAFAKAQAILLSFGVTTTEDMGASIEDWMTFRRAGDEGKLNMRIIAYAAGVDAMQMIGGPGPTPWLYADHLRMAGVKLLADGALGSRGAWLKKPYADAPTQTGLGFMDDAKLRNLMSRAAMDNFQVAVHAIGDAANAQLLGAIEELSETYKGDRRWRIEHAQIVDPADIARFGKNGVVASMQPVHETSDRLMAETRLGPDRLTGAYAWASIRATGAHLAFGSDFPVESPNPFPGMAAAITREGEDGEPLGGWQPQERVSREVAFAGYTTEAAYAGFAEDRLGRLAPGMRADFLLLDAEPLELPPGELRRLKVRETWVGGKRVYVRK